ncbi:MAG: hypothetical protein IPP66_19140 [Anaerolineales bacterium]|nr:hypothetical protein [Anaerolineales bacterium]
MAKTKTKQKQTSGQVPSLAQAQLPPSPIVLEFRQPEEDSFLLIIAEKVKNSLQLLIAVGIIIVLGSKLLYHADRTFELDWITFPKYLIIILRLPALDLVAKALAYAAGIDLAYMLLTPGPDEAIEPLILGLASAILYSISNIGSPDLRLAAEIGLYVVILSFLFLMKALFIPEEEDKPRLGIIAMLRSKLTSFRKAFKKRFNAK